MCLQFFCKVLWRVNNVANGKCHTILGVVQPPLMCFHCFCCTSGTKLKYVHCVYDLISLQMLKHLEWAAQNSDVTFHDSLQVMYKVGQHGT
jgi:hypothetical protein